MFQLNQVPKPNHKRNKPTAKQRGDISSTVRNKLHERSRGVCERCKKEHATGAAHTLRRMDIKVKTTLEDLCHACHACHEYMDSTLGGKVFKQTFKERAYRRAGREKEFYM